MTKTTASAVRGSPRARGLRFRSAELGPDREVVGDLQGLIECEVVEALEVVHAPAAAEFGR